MRLTDFLQDVGRHVAFYPAIAKLCGGVAPGVLFAQLLYWTDKTSDPEGWIYKTRLEIEDETALSRWEQETARTALRQRGFLYERFKGMPRKRYYRLDLDAVNKAWDDSKSLHKVVIQPTDEDAESQHKVGIPPSLRRKNHQHEGGKTTSNKVGKPPANTLEKSTESTAQEKKDPPSDANASETPQGDDDTAAPTSTTRAKRIPHDWQPSEQDLAWAQAKGYDTLLDLALETEEFKHFWGSQGKGGAKLDWSGTWKVRMIDQARKANQQRARASPAPSIADQRARELLATREAFLKRRQADEHR